jgi:hypothetical protein
MLTPAQVSDIYTRKAKGGKVALGFAITRDGREPITKMGDYNIEGFAGRAGTIRRNRKGATRRMPNGTRRYFGPYMDGKEVIAYKLRSK